jgi:hypothetical protein
LAWTRRCPTRRRAPTGARCGRTGVAASDRARPAKALQTPPHSGYPVVAGQSRHRARRSRPGCPLTPPPRLVHIDRESKPAQPMPTGHQRRRALHQVHCNGVALAVSSAVHRRSRLPAVKALGTHQGLSQDGVQEEVFIIHAHDTYGTPDGWIDRLTPNPDLPIRVVESRRSEGSGSVRRPRRLRSCSTWWVRQRLER